MLRRCCSAPVAAPAWPCGRWACSCGACATSALTAALTRLPAKGLQDFKLVRS